jgi:hypothetical protein
MKKTQTKTGGESSGWRRRTGRNTIRLDGDLAQESDSLVIEKDSTVRIVTNDELRIGLLDARDRAGQGMEFNLPSFPKGIGDISRKELSALLDGSDLH